MWPKSLALHIFPPFFVTLASKNAWNALERCTQTDRNCRDRAIHNWDKP